MANPVKTFFTRLARKAAMAAVVGLLALVAYCLWIFIREPAGFESRRERLLGESANELVALRSDFDRLTRDKTELSASLDEQNARLQLADKTTSALHELDPSVWDRLMGDPIEHQAHKARIARVAVIKAEAAARIMALTSRLLLTDGHLLEVTERLPLVEQQHRALAADEYPVLHYLRLGWTQAHWLVAGVVLAYLFGRFLVNLVLFYGVAPRITRGRAVQLVSGNAVLPTVQTSTEVVEDALWPGEILRVRPAFLRSSDEGLRQQRCLVLNWHRPFSCIASGLTGLVELRNERNAGERRVVFASNHDPLAQLSIVSVPDSGSFILRAGFLMGVISKEGKPVKIRRHLRLFHWQSWVSGRFGYWEFVGPCRLIVSCVSHVSIECMTASEGGVQPSQRAVQAGVVGFSPQLALKPVRCFGFWRYFRERRPLYDVELSGEGVFLASESAGRVHAKMRGNEGPVVKLLKLVGL